MSEKLEGLEQECRKVAVSALYEMSTEDGETPEEAQPDVIAEHFAAFIRTRIASAEAAARLDALEEAAKMIDDSLRHYDENEGAQRIALKIAANQIRALRQSAGKEKAGE